jgi:hypothetical protein
MHPGRPPDDRCNHPSFPLNGARALAHFQVSAHVKRSREWLSPFTIDFPWCAGHPLGTAVDFESATSGIVAGSLSGTPTSANDDARGLPEKTLERRS